MDEAPERLERAAAAHLAGLLAAAQGPVLGVEVGAGAGPLAARCSRYHGRPGFGLAPAPQTAYAGALVRWNRAREANAPALSLALAHLAPGAPIVLYGHNDDGIRSVREVVGVAFESVDALAHGRLLAGRAPATPAPAFDLARYRRTGALTLPGRAEARPWIWYPGTFAEGRLDAGTSRLLATLAEEPPAGPPTGPRAVFDFACGTGAIAAFAADRFPGARISGLDWDAYAVEAARENVPGAHFEAGSAPEAIPAGCDLILSNPPFHAGRARDHGVCRRLVAAAATRLAPGGELRLVVQREVRIEADLRARFADVRRVGGDRAYDVFAARAALGSGASKG